MNKTKYFYIALNCKVFIDEKTIKIIQGRSDLAIIMSYFAIAFSVLASVMFIISDVKYLFMLIVPISLAINALMLYTITINLSEKKIEKVVSLSDIKIYNFKPVFFTSNEFHIIELETKNSDDNSTSVSYDLMVDGNKILTFNDFETAKNIQKVVNKNSTLKMILR